jgi:hypothetical protein
MVVVRYIRPKLILVVNRRASLQVEVSTKVQNGYSEIWIEVRAGRVTVKRKQQGGEYYSPGGRRTRLMAKGEEVYRQTETLTPGGKTSVWHDRTPQGETQLGEKERKVRNKAYNLDARRVSERAQRGIKEKAIVSGARRATYAGIEPKKKQEGLKVRRETYAAIEPDAKNDLLARRRECAPVGQVCVSIVVFANQCACTHSN